MVIWEKDDPRGAAEEEPEGAEQGEKAGKQNPVILTVGNAGAGQGESQDGTAGEEADHGH